MTEVPQHLVQDGWKLVDDIRENLPPAKNQEKNTTPPTPRINHDWRKWIKENYERGCDNDTITKILKETGFSAEDIEQNMDFLWNDIFTIAERDLQTP